MSVHRHNGKYVVRWRTGNKNRSRTFRKREFADRFDLALKDQRSMGGVDPLAAERRFEEVVEAYWRSHHRSLSAATKRTQRAYLENRVIPRFSGYRLCDVTTTEIDSFRLDLLESGVGAPTIRKILYVLSGVFTHARKMGLLTYNPVDVIEKPSAGRARLIQPFPPERVEKVRNWFLDRGDLEGATMVSVLAYSGPRPAEAHERLTWADILTDSIIYRGDKTEKDRTTRLLEPLRDDLRAFRNSKGEVIGKVFGWSLTRFDEWRRGDRPGGFGQAVRDVWAEVGEVGNTARAASQSAGHSKEFSQNPSRGHPPRSESFRPYGRAVRDAGLSGGGPVDRNPSVAAPPAEFRPYDLRHAFATLLAGEGYYPYQIAEEMGNSEAVCVHSYRHLRHTGEPMDAAERIWAARKRSQTVTSKREAM